MPRRSRSDHNAAGNARGFDSESTRDREQMSEDRVAADGRRAGKEEREMFSSWFGESWATLERQTLKRSKRTRLEIRERSDT